MKREITFGLLGVAAGALPSIALGAFLWRHQTPPVVAAQPFTVSGSTVQLEGQGSAPLHFTTAAVEPSAPLLRPPVTARVATVEARTAPCFAPLDGRVADVVVRIGTHVQQGDRLILVHSGELAELKRSLAAAKLAIATKQALVDRLRLLVDSRAAPQSDLLVAESEFNEARLQAQAADAKIRSLAVGDAGDIGYWVLATRAGTVVQLDASPGKQVGPDKDKPVAVVADLDEVLVVGDVPQRDIEGLKAGMKASIHVPGQSTDPLVGEVELVSDVLDPERQTVPIRIRVKNRSHVLRAYSFVEARFLAASDARVIVVPAGAVVSDGANSVVFVESSPHNYVRREVRMGRRTRDSAEIQEGLKPGERIVVQGALLLLNAVDIAAGGR